MMLRIIIALFFCILAVSAQFGMGGFNNRGFNNNNRGFNGRGPQRYDNSYQKIILILSSPLNLLTGYLIQTKTPQRSNTYKKLLFNLHFWITANDIYNTLLYAPIPLFPIVAGYCDGILCRLGVPNHQVMNGVHMIFTNIDFSLLISYVYRHQALLHPTHFLKLTKKRAFQFALILWLLMQSLYFPRFFTADTAIDSHKLLATYPDMGWLLEKPNWSYHHMKDSDEYDWVIKYALFSPWLILFMVLHIFHILRGYSSCLLFTFIPIALITFGIITLSWSYGLPLHGSLKKDSYLIAEVNFVLFGFLFLFSTAHSISLISMTPSYRSVIMSWFGIIPNAQSVSIVSVTTSSESQKDPRS
ncbi:srh-297 [Pristionchus pacificus]|uniref:Srh-297 protein n=1 Tax=Pristionchus pacificus TaxID=54126 RepID=A0A2A6C3W2_PRIPA|nr:srh-297 [Pristionchus pacificus]|eukprot:PDM72788.1 srh-297 protein [Pristionchus pacificus]